MSQLHCRRLAAIDRVTIATSLACRKVYYGAMEKLGKQKRHRFADRFRAVAPFQGGDLEKTGCEADADYQQCEQRAATEMDPVLESFREPVLFLKHNLNTAAIASLRGGVALVESDLGARIRDLQTSIQEADAMLATLENP